MKLFVTNDFTLRLTNILSNNTGFADIYEYVLSIVKNKTKIEYISRAVIKQIIMPGVYGQSIIKMIEECNNILNKNIVWKELNIREKKKLLIKINEIV